MVATKRRSVICRSDDLVDGGRGINFIVSKNGEFIPAFVIRFHGTAYAYLNRCAHRRLKLDWNAGEFFDTFGQQLICATHGARYAPASGVCVGGPCGQASLDKLAVTEKVGEVSLDPMDNIQLVKTGSVRLKT